MQKMLMQAAIVGVIAFFLALIVLPTWQSYQQRHTQNQINVKNSLPESDIPSKTAEERIAEYTFWLTFFTAALAIVAGIQIHFLYNADETAIRTAQAAKESADVANRTLIASQRAWIRTDQIGIGGGGLAIDRNGASVAISFKITNVGNSPAINVTHHAWLIALKEGEPFPWQEQQKRCAEIRNQPFGTGFTLFPGESFPRNIGIDEWSLGTNTSRIDIEKSAALSSNKKLILLYVVGCIDYTFPTDPTIHHQTGFIREVAKNHNGHIGGHVTLEDGIIPAANLNLMDTALGIGSYAD